MMKFTLAVLVSLFGSMFTTRVRGPVLMRIPAIAPAARRKVRLRQERALRGQYGKPPVGLPSRRVPRSRLGERAL